MSSDFSLQRSDDGINDSARHVKWFGIHGIMTCHFAHYLDRAPRFFADDPVQG